MWYLWCGSGFSLFFVALGRGSFFWAALFQLAALSTACPPPPSSRVTFHDQTLTKGHFTL